MCSMGIAWNPESLWRSPLILGAVIHDLKNIIANFYGLKTFKIS